MDLEDFVPWPAACKNSSWTLGAYPHPAPQYAGMADNLFLAVRFTMPLERPSQIGGR